MEASFVLDFLVLFYQEKSTKKTAIIQKQI